MASLLFVHNNFPAQLGLIASAMAARGHDCRAVSSVTGRELAGIPLVRWGGIRGSTPGIFAPAVRAEADFIRDSAAAQAALGLREGGFMRSPTPSTTTARTGATSASIPSSRPPRSMRSSGCTRRTRPWRWPSERPTASFAPTPFQAGLLPVAFRSRTAIIYEGVDTDLVRPAPNARLTVAGRMLDRSKPIVTFINRRFEPLRGYHVFMRALPRVLAQVPEAEILLIGSDRQGGYGLPPPKGATWKQVFLDEVRDSIDPLRIHFTGPLPHGEMLAALSLSWAHVYYTYPFVLSWSLLEAMASECLVIASDTAPVRDAIRSGENGLLLDFFDHDALAEALVEACRSPEGFAPMRKAARETVVADFNRARCSAAWVDLLEGLCPSG